MRRIICIILALMLSAALSAQEKGKKLTVRDYKFKFGVLYINSPTGIRFREGIEDAIADYSKENKEYENLFKSDRYPYNNETDGLKILVSLMEERKVDIILGPTGSGVFARALEQRKDLEQSRIPVISSQVVTKIPNQKGSWFFRTNINIESRARVIYDFLNKYWIRSIAVIYEDSEFGRLAEKAFRNELQGPQKELYLPLSYDTTHKARIQIRRILYERPEAVGIFATGSEFIYLHSLLKNLNAGSSNYFPLTFSVIDIRSIKDDLKKRLQGIDSVHFVSVSDTANGRNVDDVEALAYDTTMLILQELGALAKSIEFNYKDPSWRELFRNRFESILNGDIRFKRGELNIQSKTGIFFKNYENVTTPKVLKLSKEDTGPVPPGKTIGLYEKIWHKLKSTWGRYGIWWQVNIFLIVFIVVYLSITDIKRRYMVEWRVFFKFNNPILIILPGLNLTIALFAYFYLGETGDIRYDSVSAALILALAPFALLRITFFETSTGKAIGLAKLYDGLSLWVYEKFTIKYYIKLQPYVNVIAYHNSVYGMKRLLMEIYQNAPTREQRIRMQTRMEEVLKSDDSWIGRRKAMARLLLQILKWHRLVRYNFVPLSFEGRDPDSENHLIPYDDPENLILEAARSCARDPSKIELIEKIIKEQLKMLTSERANELIYDFEKDKGEMKTHTAIMRKRITFLTLLQGYAPDFLETLCLSKKSQEVLDKAAEYCANDEEKKDVVNRIIEGLIEEKADIEKKEYKQIMKNMLTGQQIDKTSFEKKIRFLLLHGGFDENYLKKEGLLQKTYQFKDDPVEKIEEANHLGVEKNA